MNPWYSKELGDGMTAVEPSEQISAAFKMIFEAAGKPADMAVFTRLESEGRLHCEVLAYFSPASGEFARQSGAVPCIKPARSGLGLLAGDPGSWSLLFPEEMTS